MSDKVISLDERRPKDEPVYECICGGQAFELGAIPLGVVRCLGCGLVHENLVWSQYFVSGVRPDLNKHAPSS